MQRIISGIQQVGIGIPNVYEAWAWYRKHFGMDIPMFDDAGIADLMLPYTGNKPHKRHAILALNIQGGGGFEIWQYVSRTPEAADFEIQLGDYGIFIAKIKSRNVVASYIDLKNKKVDLIGTLSKDPRGKDHFYVKDPYGNLFEIVEGEDWFKPNERLTGGPAGAVIGVSDIEKSIKFYSEILGYDTVIYDETSTFGDFASIAGGQQKVRRVLLKHSKKREGAFSQLLGASEIELVQSLERDARKIYENRMWGDLGFIHLCYDVSGMQAFKEHCAAKGYPFTVDSSNSFDMGEAAGHFVYTEDPDGTLIEMVETHRIPIMKKIGWYLNLKKRNPTKPLPKWMLKTLAFNRVKED